MKQQAVYFIETKEGEKLYKADTFWSKGKVHQAKIHSDSQDDQERFFKSLISSLVNSASKLLLLKWSNA